MKAYLTTIGEKTTGICKSQLERYGFEVILLDLNRPWIEKYRHFISIADEDCLRIDSDVIVNKNIKKVFTDSWPEQLLVGFELFDFYKNDISSGSPVFYKKEALDIMKKNIDKISKLRPETSMSRLPELNPYYVVDKTIVGMHGFFQDATTIARAYCNKEARGQLEHYDFELVYKIFDLTND